MANIDFVMGMLKVYKMLPDRELGGCVHIITDDPNQEQHHADWCLANVEGWNKMYGGDTYLEIDRTIAEAFATLNDRQRRTIFESRS